MSVGYSAENFADSLRNPANVVIDTPTTKTCTTTRSISLVHSENSNSGSNQPRMLYPGGIEAVSQYIFNIGSPRCGNQHAIIFACFDKADLLSAVPDNGLVELQALGRLKTGRYFFGSDTITIKHNQPKRWPQWR